MIAIDYLGLLERLLDSNDSIEIQLGLAANIPSKIMSTWRIVFEYTFDPIEEIKQWMNTTVQHAKY